MKPTAIKHEFVESFPSQLDEGTLYVSIPYATAAHLCASGCGNKVVTPLSPVDWQLLFDGETVSLTPSVGNWQYPCRSHYWIKNDRVVWADERSAERTAANQQREAIERRERVAKDRPRLFRRLWHLFSRNNGK